MKFIIKDKILDKTLSLVDKPFSEWKTYNDKINTVLYFGNEKTRIDSSLIPFSVNELLFLECKLENSHFLITSTRLVSIVGKKVYQILIKDIVKFGNKKSQGTNKVSCVSLYDVSENEFSYKIDSMYPEFFSRILIHNLISYHRTGLLSWN